MASALCTISCHCGISRQQVHILLDSTAQFCHCDDCRHTSGQLYTSYYTLAPTEAGAPVAVAGLRKYPPSAVASSGCSAATGTMRYFCGTCGCHVFRADVQAAHDGADGATRWGVATGIVTGLAAPVSEDGPAASGQLPGLASAAHAHTASTVDGGLSAWLPGPKPDSTTAAAPHPPFPHGDHRPSSRLSLSCRCGVVRLLVTPPSPPGGPSWRPRSGFPDLTHAYARLPAEAVANPDDVKWWLCSHHVGEAEGVQALRYRYRAGTCACASCRLTSGFEVQSWAFVPRANILVVRNTNSESARATGGDDGAEGEESVPLDFDDLPTVLLPSPDSSKPGIEVPVMQAYHSSPGVTREFCPSCGATVFWHDRWRPELIDVSVGLVAPGKGRGVRVEDWLDWWTERVSFAEEAGMGREGYVKSDAEELVNALEEGLGKWGELKKSAE